MKSSDVPQANSLDRIRQFVDAIRYGATQKPEIQAVTALSSRHADYYGQAARALGWVNREGEVYSLRQEAAAMLETKPGSDEERSAFASAIEACEVIKTLAPDLLVEQGPSEDVLTSRIQQATDLSPKTARRRAQALLTWRLRVTTTQPEQEQDTLPLLIDAEDGEEAGHEPGIRLFPRVDGLRLQMFKGLRQGDFAFSGLTLFVGPHGVGKSSLRDVFRFLHGIGRGYSLSEIAGERWGEGGTLEWSGIRGGPGELSHFEQDTFSFSLRLAVPAGNQLRPVEYSIEVQSTRHHPARMVRERLVFEGRGAFVFDSHPDDDPPLQVPDRFAIRVGKALRSGARGPTLLVNPRRPALSQLALHPAVRTRNVTDSASCVLAAFRSLRFLEPTIQAMCRPSLPDQLMLGDHGENLSSVLLAIVQNQDRQQRLLRSMRDFSDGLLRDIDFIRDATGRVLLVLVDRKGARLSAYSASEGVLRFLTLSAALLGPECPGIWFMDNLDAGFGPSKLNLVLRHLEEHATTTSRQLMATMRTKDAVASLDLEPDGPSTAYELLAHASGAPQRMGTTQVARTRSKKTDESEEDLNEWLPF